MSNPITPQRIVINPGSVLQTDRQTYKVEEKIGEGGFGIVCKVTGSGKKFALKLTKMWEFMPNERLEYAKRFRQEYEYSKSLDGDHLVRSHDFALVKGNPIMTMDLCENGSLRDFFDRPPSPAKLNQFAVGILKGLATLHEQGIIHRDIKPENILFDSHKRPKLADFGISASIKKRHTQANFMGHAKAVFATCAYSPPEQMDHTRAMKVMGNTNDIYAFGATMYEWITGGHFPYGSFEDFTNDMKAFEKRRKANDWDRQTLKRESPDPKWIDIIEKCLRYNPEERYQYCDEIISLIGEPEHTSFNQPSNVAISPDTQWLLEIKNGDEIGRRYHLTNLSAAHNTTTLTLGWLNPQNPFKNHIGVAEEFTQYISQYHATLEHNPRTNYWYIRDGQLRVKNGVEDWYPSTNGVLVNSRPIDMVPHKLAPGDIIMIGDTTLKVFTS